MPEPRRSTRTRAYKPADSKENVIDDDLSQPPPKKRVKRSTTERATTAAPKKKTKGKLAKLPDMPIDILDNIFSNLMPLDLLRLLRTTKALRALLMSRSARPIWKAAMTAQGKVHCPPEICEPIYARLVLENRCFFCPALSAVNVLWSIRVRCCNKCVVNAPELVHDDFFSAKSLGQECTPDLIGFIKNGASSDRPRGRRTVRYQDIYLRRAVLTLRNTVLEISDDLKALRAFAEERKEYKEKIANKLGQCHEWSRSWDELQSKDTEANLERRRDAIIKHLSDLGWGADITRMSEPRKLEAPNPVYVRRWKDFCCHKTVAQSKDLTPRIWANIKDSLIAFMEEFKKESLEHELNRARFNRSVKVNAILREYALAHPIEENFPTIGDLNDLDALHSILDWPVEDANLDDIPQSLFDDLNARLPELTAQWRRAVALSVLARIAVFEDKMKSVDNAAQESPSADNTQAASPPDISRLQLATTLFQCYCTRARTFTYANLLMHDCLRPEVYMLPAEVDQRGYDHSNWSRQSHLVLYSVSDAAQAGLIVQLCGLDPATTTQADMDALDARFTCNGCHGKTEAKSGRIALDWRRAVTHLHGYCWDDQAPVQLARLPDAAAAFAKSLEPDLKPHLDTLRYTKNWTCVRCRTHMSGCDLLDHLAEVHAVADPQPEDYRLALDFFVVPESVMKSVWIPLPDDE